MTACTMPLARAAAISAGGVLSVIEVISGWKARVRERGEDAAAIGERELVVVTGGLRLGITMGAREAPDGRAARRAGARHRADAVPVVR